MLAAGLVVLALAGLGDGAWRGQWIETCSGAGLSALELDALPDWATEHNLRLGITPVLLDISKKLDDWRGLVTDAGAEFDSEIEIEAEQPVTLLWVTPTDCNPVQIEEFVSVDACEPGSISMLKVARPGRSSVSSANETERGPDGQRTVTASTHVPMSKLLGMSPGEQGDYVATIQARMRETIRKRASGLIDGLCFEATASPRTFERFTGRHLGYVGGVPRRVGLRHYRPRALLPREAERGLYAVGDSVLLGQSTLAVALGGVRTAEVIAKRDT